MSEVVGMRIPEGTVLEMMDKDRKTYCPHYSKRYVSFGDSIAAGHAITVDWEKTPFDISKGYYAGTNSQFGSRLEGYKKYNEYTVIVADTYTDLLLKNSDGTLTLSFAKSGQTVDTLIPLVEGHQMIRDAIAKANIVTLCIGANEVLQPALADLGTFFVQGYPTLDAIEKGAVKANLDRLAGDESVHSYRRLFTALQSINPNATYTFTTVYNPMKYLHLDKATASSGYTDGFFAPLLQWMRDYVSIPALDNITIDGWNFNSWLRSLVVNVGIVQALYARVNGESDNEAVSAWAERQLEKLNNTLATAISDFNKKGYANFKLVDTKALFDQYPDRLVSKGQNIVRYNDITNVEFTRGFDLSMIDWWQYWWYWDNGEGFANDIVNAWNDNYEAGIAAFITGVITSYVTNVVDAVIMPDIDVHPEAAGHAVMYHAFANAFGFEQTLKTRTLSFENTKGGGGSVASITVPYIDVSTITGKQNIPYVKLPSALGFTVPGPFTFKGWNTSADGNGTRYEVGDVIPLTSDLKLYADWDDEFTINVTTVYNDDCKTYYTIGAGVGVAQTGRQQDYYIQRSQDNGATWSTIFRGTDTNEHIGRLNKSIKVKYGDKLRVYVAPYNYASTHYSAWGLGDSYDGNTYHVYRHWWSNLTQYFGDVLESTAFTDDKGNIVSSDGSADRPDKFQSTIVAYNGAGTLVGKKQSGVERSNYNNAIYIDIKVLGDASIEFDWYAPHAMALNWSQSLWGLSASAKADIQAWNCTIKGNVGV